MAGRPGNPNLKGGAPQANRNAMRHGLRAGMLPKGAAYIKRECDTMRREIETAVLARHGEVDLYRAALIQTAMRWERHGMLVQRWLRKEAVTMDAAQRLAYSRDIARASENRDRCLKELGLNVDETQNAIDAWYSADPDDALESPDTPSHGESAKEGKNTSPRPQARTGEAKAREEG